MKKIFTNILLVLSFRERKRFFQLVILNFIISVADIAALALLLLIINFYIQPTSSSYMEFLPAWLTDRNSVALIALFLLLFALKNLFAYLIHKAQYRFVYTVASDISEKKLLNYLKGNFLDYINIDSSVHIYRISHQPAEFAQYLLANMQQMITQVILVALTALAILFFNFKLFLILLAILLPAMIWIAYIAKKRLQFTRKHVKTSNEKTLQYLKEALSSYVETNIYDKYDFFKKRYVEMQKQLNTSLADLQTIQGMPNRLIEVFAIAGLFILIAINHWINNNVTDLITIGAFMAAAYKIIPGIVKILNLNGQIHTYAYTATDLLNSKNETNEKKNTNDIKQISSIQFKNIFFRYKDEWLLDNLNLTVERGEFLGISGLSGKGKTTLLNLLLGFVTPGSGEILVNDKPKNNLELQEYWPGISYVKQENFLIHDTLLKNITLNDELPDEKKLTDVIRISGLDDLINSNTDGINKLIMENGKNISGGQRQRIAIARVLYKETGLIILDEPFSELDEKSEECLLKYFKQLSESGKIVILITHNKKSLSFCTQIISLDEQA